MGRSSMILVLGLLLSHALSGSMVRAEMECPADPAPSELKTLFGKLKIHEWNSESRKIQRSWTVESALSPAAQARGMMYRKKLPSDEGMVFVFPDVQRRSFWMKNTCIPLDMVFLSELQSLGPDGLWGARIEGVVTAEPLTLRSRSIAVPARAVLELTAGEARRRGWKRGQFLILEGVDPVSSP